MSLPAEISTNVSITLTTSAGSVRVDAPTTQQAQTMARIFARSLRPKQPPFEVRADCVRPLDDVKREAVQHAMQQLDGNKEQVARALGIGSRTLYRYLERWGMHERNAR